MQQNLDEIIREPGTGVVEVHEELVRLVRQLMSGDRLPVGELTFAQHSLLAFIARNPGCRATQISDAFAVHRSTVSRQLRGCVDAGWVHAEQGPSRSGYPLSLTPDGTVALSGADARRVEEVRERVADWADDDVDDFARVLRRFRQGATHAPATPAVQDSIGDDTRA